MQKAKGGGLFRVEPAPIVERGGEQGESADDIGLDEGARPVDGAIDMALGGQMHHRIGPERVEGGGDGGAVAYVGAAKGIARIAGDGRERIEIAGIGELVEDEQLMRRRLDDAAGDGRADESGAAGHEQAHLSAHSVGGRRGSSLSRRESKRELASAKNTLFLVARPDCAVSDAARALS